MAKVGRQRIQRKRVAVLLRIDPDMAAWYKRAASRAGRSRTLLMEMCLGRVRGIVEVLAQWERDGISPGDVESAIGGELAASLLELGMGSDVLRAAVAFRQQRNREIRGVANGGGR